MTQSSQTLATETVLALLTKPLRRAIIDRLAEASGPTTVAGLAEMVREPTAVDSTRHDSPDAPTARLHHVDLPMLTEANVIEYDPETKTVRRGTHFEEVAALQDLIASHRGDGSVAFS